MKIFIFMQVNDYHHLNADAEVKVKGLNKECGYLRGMDVPPCLSGDFAMGKQLV